MAQQLEQSNPGLVNNLRQTMQNIGGENTSGNENTDNTRQEGIAFYTRPGPGVSFKL